MVNQSDFDEHFDASHAVVAGYRLQEIPIPFRADYVCFCFPEMNGDAIPLRSRMDYTAFLSSVYPSLLAHHDFSSSLHSDSHSRSAPPHTTAVQPSHPPSTIQPYPR